MITIKQTNNIIKAHMKSVSIKIKEDKIYGEFITNQWQFQTTKTINYNMINDTSTYIIITSLEIQKYQDEPDFEENSCLINDSKVLDKYGSSAYFVDKEWINKVHQRWHDEDYADSFKREIEDINFLSNL